MTSSKALSENIALEEHASGVTVLKITRGAVLNALNTQTLHDLKSALLKIAESETTRVLVFTGEGEKAFIAGADILEMKDKSTSEGIEFALLGHSVAKLLETLPQPTIAAVNGFALGGGTEMAIACDMIVASENAVFGQPEVGLGIIPGFGGTFRLARYIGWPKAKELIFSGKKIKAKEAQELGLVNHLFSKDDFMKEVLAFAETIAKQSFSAVATAKKLMNTLSDGNALSFKIDVEAQSFGRLFGSHDQREGMGAFSEKRKPKFKGLGHE